MTPKTHPPLIVGAALDDRSIGSRMVRASVSRTAGMLVSIAVGFVTLPYMVAGLGTTWYGVWVTLSSIIGSYYLLDLGFSAGVMRYVAQALGTNDHERANVVVTTALVVYTALAAVLLVVTAVLVAAVPLLVDSPPDVTAVRVALALGGFSLSVSFPAKAFAGIIQARIRYDLLSVVSGALTVATAIAIVITLRRGGGIVAVAVITTLFTQGGNLAYVLISRSLLPTLRIRRKYADRVLFRELLRFSSWAFLIDLANQLRYRVDALTVAWLFSAGAVTHFSIGARLTEYVLNALGQATNFATPVLTQLDAAGRRDALKDAVLFLTRLNALLAIYGIVMLSMFSGPFILRWMGPEYEGSSVIAIALAFGFFFDYVHYPITNVMYAMSRHQRLAWMNMVEAVLNVGCSVALSFRYGILGVALGTSIPLVFMRAVFVGPWGCHLVGLAPGTFYYSMGRPVALGLASGACAFVAVKALGIRPDYFWLLVDAGIATCVFWPIALFGLSLDDRRRLLEALPGGLPVQRWAGLYTTHQPIRTWVESWVKPDA